MTATLESPPTETVPQRIEIAGVGPIAGTFNVELDGPGVYVLRGSKGRGKSTALSCVELLAGHKVDITLNDRSLDGHVSGFGSTIPITRARIGKRKGEFEGTALDAEKFTISDIVDPPIKDAAKADAHRIKALASLARVHIQPSDFRDLLGSEEAFDALVRPFDLESDDPVVVTSRIKTIFDAEARKQESLADRAEGQAQACMQSVAGLDLDSPFDPAALAAAVDAAVAARSQIVTLAAEAERSAKLKADAKSKLDKVRAAYTGPTVARAEAMREQADKDSTATLRRVEELRQQLRDAEVERDKANARRQSAMAAVTAAQQQAELTAQLEELLDAGEVQAPDQAELAAAEETLLAARAAAEEGVRIRDGKRRLADGNAHLSEAQACRENALKLRGAAAATFDVLMRAVKLDGVRIRTYKDAPRLVVDHKKRGECLFSDLSDGERTLTAIKLLLPVLRSEDGVPGIFPISQRLAQDLPPADFDEIDAFAKANGIYIFAGLVDNGELRCEKWGEK